MGRGSSVGLRVAVALALLGAPAQAAPGSERATRLGGVASFGLGTGYAGVGLQLLYLQPLPLRPLGLPLSLSASGAYGMHSVLDGRSTLDGQDQRLTGFSFMAGVSAGHMHRACVGAGWGVLGGAGVPIEGLVVETVNVYGPFLEAGYELLAANGLFVRVLPLGLAYLPRTRWRASAEVHYSGSVGIGWKPW
jgi:hypothetical protein